MAPKVLNLLSKMALFDEMWAPAYFATKAYTRTSFQWLTLPSQKDPREPRFKGQGPRGRGYVLATKDWAELDTFFVGLGSTLALCYLSEAFVFTMQKIQSQKKNFWLNRFPPIFVSCSFYVKRTCPRKNPEEKTKYKKKWSFWLTRWVYLRFASG